MINIASTVNPQWCVVNADWNGTRHLVFIGIGTCVTVYLYRLELLAIIKPMIAHWLISLTWIPAVQWKQISFFVVSSFSFFRHDNQIFNQNFQLPRVKIEPCDLPSDFVTIKTSVNQESISSTFYVHVLCTKVLCTAFL